MKTILLILGPNGVGKSTAAKVLASRLPLIGNLLSWLDNRRVNVKES